MERETTISPPPRAGRKEWIGLAVIALACVLYVMDLTVLHLASALSLGGHDTIVVTWDRTLALATTAAGLAVAPGRAAPHP